MINCSVNWNLVGGATAALLAAVYVFWGPSKPRKRKGFPGLHNFGNSCFLNVILQSWAACPSLLHWLGARGRSNKDQPSSLTAAVFKVLNVLNNGGEDSAPDVYSPGDVLTAMERKGWVISPGQQDCHELMHALSETLDEEICSQPKVISLFDVKSLQDSRGSHVAMGRTRVSSQLPVLPRRPESPLHGLLASQISCLACGHQAPVKYDMFDCLTLSMPLGCLGETSVEKLLGAYVRPEVIDNARCPRCDKQRSTTRDRPRPAIKRTLTVGKLPQCLSLHIQRLQLAEDGQPIKRCEHVAFPESLTMDSFLYGAAGSHVPTKNRLCGGRQAAEGYRASGPLNLLRALNYDASTARNGLFLKPPCPLLLPPGLADVNHNGPTPTPDVNHNLFKKQGGGQHVYRLTAVISHLGGVESGHFLTFRRGPLRPRSEHDHRLSDTWWLASDCRVEPVALATVLSSQAYMLFYERV